MWVVAILILRVERTLFRPALKAIVIQILEIGTDANAPDRFLTDVEPTAPTAPVDTQLITFTDVAGRSVPQL